MVVATTRQKRKPQAAAINVGPPFKLLLLEWGFRKKLRRAMNKKYATIGLGLAVGVGLGAALGAAAGAVSIWLAAGVAFGVLFMAAAQKASKQP
jgi:uncharacterized membrane protein YoaK (UPF0700 family)